MSDVGDAFETPPDGFPITPIAYECPSCGQTVHAIPGPIARLLECPDCEERFLIPAQDGSTDLPEETGPSDAQNDERDLSELDSLRMRHMVVTRRTAMRSRTYNLLGAAACLMGAIKLGIETVKEFRATGFHVHQVAAVLVALIALFAVRFFLKRAAHWARQSQGSKIPDPETPPDFTPLSDGSQHARNLEDLH
jgi:DNA-directed RNA polymerase subunit RPC12/RpoP